MPDALTVRYTAQMRRDRRVMERRGADMRRLDDVIDLLRTRSELPPNKNDHALVGNWTGIGAVM